MTRILIATAALLTIISSGVCAETYKCQDQYGTTVFTDELSPNLTNCIQEQPGELPALNVTPNPAEEGDSVQNPASQDSSIDSYDGAKSFEEFRDETEELVNRFNDARRQLYMTGLIRSKIEARRELAAIRADKETLLQEIEDSPLYNYEREELLEKLAVITE